MAKRKPLSGAERQRKYMAKKIASRDQHEQYLLNERKRWQDRKNNKKIKSVAEMTEREKRTKRKLWNASKRAQRQKRKQELAHEQDRQNEIDTVPSPPATPEIIQGPIILPHGGLSRQFVQGQLLAKRNRDKTYRENAKLRAELMTAKREVERFKRRNQRLLKAQQTGHSPRSKTKTMLDGCKVTKQVKRTLLFHNTIVTVLKEKNKALVQNKTKKMLRDLFLHQLMIKYHLQKLMVRTLGISCRRKARAENQKCKGLSLKTMKKIQQYFQSDDVSRITTGKRDTITKNAEKRQRRVLLDTIQNLHVKFCADNPLEHVSYSLFCTLRPFHVVHASARDRQTCLCKVHENGQLMFDKLNNLKLLPPTCNSLEKCIEGICCDGGKEECYNRRCSICRDKSLISADGADEDTEVCWWEWTYEVNDVLVRGSMKRVRKTVKKLCQGKLKELIERFNDHVAKKLCPHAWRVWRQSSALKDAKQDADAETVNIIVDFSENYNCKYARETQSTHFGASQIQVTLHTGVAYINNKPVSFCSVSPSYRHDPPAIWAHLLPVFEYLKKEHPNLQTVNMWSDGPTTQYRNKHNFWLFNHLIHRFFPFATWNMFEAGHGKGAADAIGGVVKRCADDAVKMGRDLPDALSVFKLLSDKTSVKIFFVEEIDIAAVTELIPPNMAPIKGTMEIHQVISDSNRSGALTVRNISCFCKRPDICACYNPQLCQIKGKNDTNKSPTDAFVPKRNCKSKTSERLKPKVRSKNQNKQTEVNKGKQPAAKKKLSTSLATVSKTKGGVTFCLVCGESFEDKNGWIQCTECLEWSHFGCTDGGEYYICHNCDDG